MVAPRPKKYETGESSFVADEEGCRCPEGCDLGRGDVDEDDLASKHVKAQVGMNAREDEAHEKRCPEQRQQVGHPCTRLLQGAGERR